MFDLFEAGFKSALQNQVALSYFESNAISEKIVMEGMGRFNHDMIIKCIDDQVKLELAIKNSSEIKTILYWFQQNISADINLAFVSSLISKEKPTAIKAIIDIDPETEYDVEMLELIASKLNEMSISYILLDGIQEPLSHPQIHNILEFFKVRNYRIKLTTGESNLEFYEKAITESVAHLKYKLVLKNGNDKDTENALLVLKRIVEKTKKWKFPVKTHLNLIFQDFSPEVLLKHLIIATEYGISRVSINIHNRSQKNLNLINSIINQYDKQIQIYLDADDDQRNDYQSCYIPSIRYVLSSKGDVYPCFKYGIEKKETFQEYHIGRLDSLNNSTFFATLKKAQEDIDPLRCKYCSYGESSLNKKMNQLFTIINTNKELKLYRKHSQFPETLIDNIQTPSELLRAMNAYYQTERESLIKSYDKLFCTDCNQKEAKELIEAVSRKERLIREIYYAWEMMFNSKTAKKGEKILQSIELNDICSKISTNVIAVQGKLPQILDKIVPESVIFTDREPFAFISKQLPGYDFMKARRIVFIGDIADGDDLTEVLNDLKNCEASTLIGIGGGKTMDMLKFVGFKTGLTTIAVPTSLATHVYASPKIHILKPIADLGYEKTIDGEPVHLSVIDIELLDKLESDNISLIRAGLGDILAFYTAKEDWKLAYNSNNDTSNTYVELLIDEIIN